MANFCIANLLLLLSGDVELNPGPPKRVPGSGAPKGPTKEEQMSTLELKVKEYEDKMDKFEKQISAQTTEIKSLRTAVDGLLGFDEKLHMLTHKIDAITGVYDDLHEKMHEIDKTRKNNLLMYGIRPDFLPEIQTQLEHKVHEIFRHNLQISRDVPTTKISRMLTGPEVRGCRPVLINFASWKDREEVLAKSKLLRGTNIYVTEDLSRKLREHRSELTKFMREIRSKSPNKRCAIRYDKLYIENTPYVFDEERGTVVRYYAPEPLRSGSRTNYSTLDGGLLVRSTSVPSVNGVEQQPMSLHSAHSERGERGGSRTSLGSRRGDYASTESLQLTAQPQNSLPPTVDEQGEEDATLKSEDLPQSPRSNPMNGSPEKRLAQSPSPNGRKHNRSDEEVAPLQLKKKEKKAQNDDVEKESEVVEEKTLPNLNEEVKKAEEEEQVKVDVDKVEPEESKILEKNTNGSNNKKKMNKK